MKNTIKNRTTKKSQPNLLEKAQNIVLGIWKTLTSLPSSSRAEKPTLPDNIEEMDMSQAGRQFLEKKEKARSPRKKSKSA